MKGASMRLILTFTLLLFTASAVLAQVPKPSPSPTPEGSTKLEKFQARAGSVLIKGYTVVGNLSGTGGSVTVKSMELTDAQSGRKEQGIVITVEGSGRYDHPYNSFIDSDEIDSLIKGIDYIAKTDKTVTQQTNFEARYQTRGDFNITTFNSSRDNNISVAISSGRIGGESVYLQLEQLEKLKELILMAKGKLEGPKP
jgi:hypothetical protein